MPNSAGDDHVIKVWNVNGNPLSTIRPSSGFLGQRNAFTRSLAFHPHLMVMAASGDNGSITVRNMYNTRDCMMLISFSLALSCSQHFDASLITPSIHYY